MSYLRLKSATGYYARAMQFIALACLLLPSLGCARDYPEWSSWDEAREWIEENYRGDKRHLDSSLIHSVEHFGHPHDFLFVTFHSDRSKPYIYVNVPHHMFNQLLHADSPGRWYHANLKGNRRYFLSLR